MRNATRFFVRLQLPPVLELLVRTRKTSKTQDESQTRFENVPNYQDTLNSIENVRTGTKVYLNCTSNEMHKKDILSNL